MTDYLNCLKNTLPIKMFFNDMRRSKWIYLIILPRVTKYMETYLLSYLINECILYININILDNNHEN